MLSDVCTGGVQLGLQRSSNDTVSYPPPAVQEDRRPDTGSAGPVRGQLDGAGATAAGAGEAPRGAEEAAG